MIIWNFSFFFFFYQIDKIRKKQLLEANREEEKTIKRLEKLLGIDKKKKKGSAGLGDGLDCILFTLFSYPKI